jgi:hypothetical protein
MLYVAAKLVAAQVIELKTIRNRAVEVFPYSLVNQNVPVMEPALPVSAISQL